jgi:hypothetical protein
MSDAQPTDQVTISVVLTPGSVTDPTQLEQMVAEAVAEAAKAPVPFTVDSVSVS